VIGSAENTCSVSIALHGTQRPLRETIALKDFVGRETLQERNAKVTLLGRNEVTSEV